jgi:hypothetical protein
LPYRSPDPDSLSLWLVASVTTVKGSEPYVHQLPEPLLRADLQTALLRFLVIQSQAIDLTPEIPAEMTQEAPE